MPTSDPKVTNELLTSLKLIRTRSVVSMIVLSLRRGRIYIPRAPTKRRRQLSLNRTAMVLIYQQRWMEVLRRNTHRRNMTRKFKQR